MHTLVVDGVKRPNGTSRQPVQVVKKPDSQPRPPISPGVLSDIRPRQPIAASTLMALVDTPSAPSSGNRFNFTAFKPYLLIVPIVALVGLAAVKIVHARSSIQSAPAASAPVQAAAPAAETAAATPPPAAATASPAADVAAASTQLQQLLTSITSSLGAPSGIVVKDLKSGAEARSSDQQVFTSASLYKLFVAQAIYRNIDTGSMSLSDAAGGGTGQNIRGCLSLMITISDNACGSALGTKLGWQKYNATLANQGFTKTNLGQPLQTTAADVALLFERLYQGTLLSPNSSGQFLDLLKAQRINNRLPAGLPGGTVIAHKTGDLDGLVHDAGIIYGPKTDYLVVMTSGPWNNVNDAPAKFADLSAKLYAQFNQ